jgi:penicillin-binding protein 2
MDPRNGEVLALGSYPSFDANLFAKPISQRVYDRLSSEENGAPLFNRAIAATYPTGSTFKPITAIAALETGAITTSQTIFDDGTFELGGREFKNAGDAVFGSVNMTQALTVSSDVFFYNLGLSLNNQGPVLQQWARRLGVGRKTGIDIPGEFNGLVPDREWRDEGYDDYVECTKENKVTPGTTQALFACGGIERPWSAGDNVNLAVGQGDLQATPLQLAVAYSTIANGGKVVRPHLGQKIEDGQGRQVEELRTSARARAGGRSRRSSTPTTTATTSAATARWSRRQAPRFSPTPTRRTRSRTWISGSTRATSSRSAIPSSSNPSILPDTR